MHDPVDDLKVRVRCPECRVTFHERIRRVVHGDRVICPGCHNEMRFHGIGHHHDHEDIARYVHHVEERTCHPHFSRRER